MQDWLSYRLSDFILFSPRTYYRMFELYHQAVWPAQLIVLAAVVAIIVLLTRNDRWRDVAVAALLAACWFWVAVAFQLRRYATINWAARYFAVLFFAQGALLVWYGLVRRRLVFDRSRLGRPWLAPALFLLAVALPPLAGAMSDRTWAQVELVGLTPDATTVATLGLLIASSPRAPRLLAIAPLAWCVIGGATLWALESPEAWVSVGAGILGLTALMRNPRDRRSDPVR